MLNIFLWGRCRRLSIIRLFILKMYTRRGGLPQIWRGKSGRRIFVFLLQQENKAQILIVADGAAFGSEMEKLMNLLNGQKNAALFLPESFEWLLLKSGVVAGDEVEKILLAPCEYIESKEYFSWERYFTHLLVSLTEDSYLKYSKRVLNPVYMRRQISDKVLSVMEKIDFYWKDKDSFKQRSLS